MRLAGYDLFFLELTEVHPLPKVKFAEEDSLLWSELHLLIACVLADRRSSTEEYLLPGRQSLSQTYLLLEQRLLVGVMSHSQFLVNVLRGMLLPRHKAAMYCLKELLWKVAVRWDLTLHPLVVH